MSVNEIQQAANCANWAVSIESENLTFSLAPVRAVVASSWVNPSGKLSFELLDFDLVKRGNERAVFGNELGNEREQSI
jgi:hypothetical protein